MCGGEGGYKGGLISRVPKKDQRLFLFGHCCQTRPGNLMLPARPNDTSYWLKRLWWANSWCMVMLHQQKKSLVGNIGKTPYLVFSKILKTPPRQLKLGSLRIFTIAVDGGDPPPSLGLLDVLFLFLFFLSNQNLFLNIPL